MHIVQTADLGNRPYKETWDFQEERLQHVINQKLAKRLSPEITPDNYLFLVEHPPVFTLGKSGKPEHLLISEKDLEERGIAYYRNNRGGDITFHGTGQLVGYPILDLDQFYTDIHRYLREIEETIILTIAEFGINNGERIPGLTGVWVGDRKVCAIGVRASRWVTMHGFALNVNTDLQYFDWIIPCGIEDKGVTSMKEILGYSVDMQKVKTVFKRIFAEIFQARLVAYEI